MYVCLSVVCAFCVRLFVCWPIDLSIHLFLTLFSFFLELLKSCIILATQCCARGSRMHAFTNAHIIFPYRPILYLSIGKSPGTKHLVGILRFLGQWTVDQIRIKRGENYFGGNYGVKFPRFIIIDPSAARILINQENFILEFHENLMY